MSSPRVSIVIPAYEEGDTIIPCLEGLADAVTLPFEALVVVDTADDSTVAPVEKFATKDDRFRVVVQDYGRGPAQAIRFGMANVGAPVTVVTMADGSDDVRVIDDMVRLVERGFAVVAASRYMPGGQQIGGPKLKGLMSKTAGRTLYTFARVGTRDATNSFKAYSTEYLRSVNIESRDGFELALELTAKAKRRGLRITEVPSIWLDRDEGQSNFRLKEWLPKYLHWYFHAYGSDTRTPMANKSRENQ